MKEAYVKLTIHEGKTTDLSESPFTTALAAKGSTLILAQDGTIFRCELIPMEAEYSRKKPRKKKPLKLEENAIDVKNLEDMPPGDVLPVETPPE